MQALTLKDTNILKGVALLMLLFHHCFYMGEGYEDFLFRGHPVVKNLGVFCKVCVSLFVFLSGYGLTVSAMKAGGLGNVLVFYKRRLTKLMVNYWFIWLLFVPMGVFVFGRTFPQVYGEDYVLKALWDFLGLHLAMTGSPFGYNATWWFYSCIIMLYLLFPLVWWMRYHWPAMVSLAVMFPAIVSYIPILRESSCGSYFMAFVCGMSLAYTGISLGGGKILNTAILMLLFFLASFYRFVVKDNLIWDAAIVVTGVMLYSQLSIPSPIARSLHFLGVHSYNIFLFHTFIYGYYFHDYIFWSNNPVSIYITLLLVCVIISVGIERLRGLLQLDRLQNKIIE